jgi:hypothetical protein
MVISVIRDARKDVVIIILAGLGADGHLATNII